MKTNFATSTLPYRENEVRSSKRQGGEARLSPPPPPRRATYYGELQNEVAEVAKLNPARRRNHHQYRNSHL